MGTVGAYPEAGKTTEPNGTLASIFPGFQSDAKYRAVEPLLERVREIGLRVLHTDLMRFRYYDTAYTLLQDEVPEEFGKYLRLVERMLSAMERSLKNPSGLGHRHPVLEPTFRPFSVRWKGADKAPFAKGIRDLGTKGTLLAGTIRDLHPDRAHQYQRAAAKIANFVGARGPQKRRMAGKKLRHVLRCTEQLKGPKARQLVCLIKEMLWLRSQEGLHQGTPLGPGVLKEAPIQFRKRKLTELNALPNYPEVRRLARLVRRSDRLKERLVTAKGGGKKQLTARLRGLSKKLRRDIRQPPNSLDEVGPIVSLIAKFVFVYQRSDVLSLWEDWVRFAESGVNFSCLSRAIDPLSLAALPGLASGSGYGPYLLQALALLKPVLSTDQLTNMGSLVTLGRLHGESKDKRRMILQLLELLGRQTEKEAEFMERVGPTLYLNWMYDLVSIVCDADRLLRREELSTLIAEHSRLIHWVCEQDVTKGVSKKQRLDVLDPFLMECSVRVGAALSNPFPLSVYCDLKELLAGAFDFLLSIPVGYRGAFLEIETFSSSLLHSWRSETLQKLWRARIEELDKNPVLSAYRLHPNPSYPIRFEIMDFVLLARQTENVLTLSWQSDAIKSQFSDESSRQILATLSALPYLFRPRHQALLLQILTLSKQIEASVDLFSLGGAEPLLAFLAQRRRHFFDPSQGEPPILSLLGHLKTLKGIEGKERQEVVTHLIDERGLVANPRLALTPELIQALIPLLRAATTQEELIRFSLFFLQSTSLEEFCLLASQEKNPLLTARRAAVLRSRAALTRADQIVRESDSYSEALVEASLTLYKNVAISREEAVHEALLQLASSGPHRVSACVALCAIEGDPKNKAQRDLVLATLGTESTGEQIEQLLPWIVRFDLESEQVLSLLAFVEHPVKKVRHLAIKALAQVPHELAQMAVLRAIQTPLWNEYDEHYGLHRDVSGQHFHWLRFRPESHDNRENLFLRSLDQLAERQKKKVAPLAKKLMKNWKGNEELKAFKKDLDFYAQNASRCVGAPLYLPPKTFVGRVLCDRGPHTQALLDVLLHGCAGSDLVHCESAWSGNWARLGFSFAAHHDSYLNWYNPESGSCLLISSEYHNEQQRLGALRVENENGFNSVFYRGVPKKWIQKFYVPASFKADLQRIFSEETPPDPKTFAHPDLKKIPTELIPDLQREIRRDGFFHRLAFVKPRSNLKKLIAGGGFTLCTQEEVVMESLKRHAARMVVREQLEVRLGKHALLLPHRRWGALDDQEFAGAFPKLIALLPKELQEALAARNNHGRNADGTRHSIGEHTVELVQGRHGGFGLRTGVVIEKMGEKAVRRVLRLAALFHDMGKKEGRGKDHIARSVAICRRHLYQNPDFFGTDSHETELVAGLIQASDSFGEYLMDKISIEQVADILGESKGKKVTLDEWTRLQFAFFAADASTLRVVQRHKQHYEPLLAAVNALSGSDLTWLVELKDACMQDAGLPRIEGGSCGPDVASRR